ncbi:pyruvate kinase [Tanacetum coccineum]
MTWHATGKCTELGKMQHPVDGRAWMNFDTKYPNFVKEPRNVQLGLAADGFNPFGNLSQAYNMWPVILTTYNLPPWLCMKESSFMLTLLIPSLKSPSKDIDVYLRPLIDDLKIEDGDPPTKFNWNQIQAQLARLPTCVKGKHPSYGGLKSHDYHIMMQRLLPYGLQQYLPDEVVKPIIELCSFFKQICSATLMEDDMLKAQSKVVDILCDLELIYPPALFDIMIHLRLLKAGYSPRWMYPFEDTWNEAKRSSWPRRHMTQDPEVDGVRYVVHSRDERHITQNAGICYSPGPDGRMYYGRFKKSSSLSQAVAFMVSGPGYYLTELAAATVATAYASVRQWLATTVAAAWWRVGRHWWFLTNQLPLLCS